MIAAVLLLLAAGLQDASQPGAGSAKPTPWAEDIRSEGVRQTDSMAGGLRAVQQFGACVANASTEKASQLIAADFRTPEYRRAMDVLVDVNRGCPASRTWYRMRSSRLLVAGAIAERLIERDANPVNVRLARAAMAPATTAFSPSDAGAICVVRSAPDDVAKLFATEMGSEQEKAAAAPLQSLLARCMNGAEVEANVPALRAIVATAAFRSLHGAQPQKRNAE